MAAEAVEFCSALIHIDSTNTGDPATTGDGESRCAEYIQSLLAEFGLDGELLEKTAGRGNLVVRMKGSDPDAPALLVHGHTDVVPANRADWTMDPFSGEVKDGFVWGRGAVDMKDMVAMTVAAVRQLRREEFVPQRVIVFAFVADEEIAGEFGAQFLADEHPDLFHGVTDAIGEIGGFSLQVRDDLRLYLLGVAEKGVAWATLTAHGTTGHGSIVPNESNAVARLSSALTRISEHNWPVVRSSSLTALVKQLGEVLGRPLDIERLDDELASLGLLATMLLPGLRTSTVPTQFLAGYKTNVVPGTATATIDCRIAPGTEDEFKKQFMDLLGPGIEVSWQEGRSLEAPAHGALLETMQKAITAVDPTGKALPFAMSGATDAKAFSQLGINCYGFSPLRLPEGFDFAGMFHGIDERVPVTAVHAGTRILHRFLASQ